MAGIMDLMKVILMILAANAAVGVITEPTQKKKARGGSDAEEKL